MGKKLIDQLKAMNALMAVAQVISEDISENLIKAKKGGSSPISDNSTKKKNDKKE